MLDLRSGHGNQKRKISGIEKAILEKGVKATAVATGRRIINRFLGELEHVFKLLGYFFVLFIVSLAIRFLKLKGVDADYLAPMEIVIHVGEVAILCVIVTGAVWGTIVETFSGQHK